MSTKPSPPLEDALCHSPVRVAVLGTGSVGTRYLSIMNEAPGFSSIAVPLRPSRAIQLAQQGQDTAVDLWEAVKKGATLCVVATDTGRHVQDGIQALDCGLDVLVEKPMATSWVEAARLLRHAKQCERRVFVGCVMRFSESLNTFQRWLGAVGDLHSVRIECQSYLPDWRPQRPYHESYAARAVEGGVLLDLIHEIDYAGWLFGWPGVVQGKIRNLGRLGIAADEAAELSWETPTGCAISINLDYLSRPPRRVMRAYGALGTIEWEGFGGTVTLMADGAKIRELRSPQTRNDTFLAQARAFARAVHGSHDPRLASAEEGMRALAICDAARRSSDSRREEAVECQ